MTILLARGAGDPLRIAHLVRVLRPSTLDEVAESIAAYASLQLGPVFIERLDDDTYRWSPTTRGGPYPLTRLIASFLGCSHHDLTIGFVTVDMWCVAADPTEPRSEHWAVLEDPDADPPRLLTQLTDLLSTGR